jgi:hypothetical protein
MMYDRSEEMAHDILLIVDITKGINVGKGRKATRSFCRCIDASRRQLQSVIKIRV